MQRVSFKYFILCILLLVLGLMTAYVLFISLISIHVGMNNPQYDGFWVPIIAGSIAALCSLWILYFFSRIIIRKIRQKDFLEI